MNKKTMMILAAVVVIGGLWFLKDSGVADKAGVRVSKVMAGGSEDRVTLEGVVQPEESATTTIYAEVPVVIEKVDTVVGAKVKKGDLLVTFTEEAKREAQKALEEVNIQLNNQEAVADSMARQAKNAKEEAEVSANQLAVEEELLKADAISSKDLAKTRSVANRDRSNSEDLAARKLIETQKYNMLKTKHEDLAKKLAFVEKDLRAPKSGIVTALPIEAGAILREGQRVVALAEEGSYKVMVEAPANLINSIKEGAKATVRDQSAGGGKVFEARVDKVSRVARDDAKKNKVIDVELKLQNADGLNPGFLTSVEISGTTNQNAKMVDNFSVVEENGNSYVFTVQDGEIRKVPVKTGVHTASKIEILDLPEGTEIVVNPGRVKEGQKVKVIR